MVHISPFTTSILNAAGDASKSNAATTMLTTGLGFVRTGMVPLDKKTSKDEKAQVMTWMVAATLLSLITQSTVYRSLGGVLDNINIKNLKLSQFANEYKALQKLPLDQIDEAIKAAGSNSNNWNVIRKSVLKAFDLKNPKEKELARTLLKNLKDIARKGTGSAKNVSNDFAKKVLENVKTMKGSGQFFMFLFGAALLTGFVIPAFICKFLPNMLEFGHKVMPKVIPEPKKRPEGKEKKSSFKVFGLPLLASGGLLGFLRYHKLNMEKGFGKALNKAMKAIGKWDYHLNPNARIARNILTNAILRPAAALVDGRLYLAVYNFIIEGLGLGGVIGCKKALGSAEKGTGLVGKAVKGLKLTNPKQIKGLEFIMTHSISTYLFLGVILGLSTNVISRHLSKFLKEKLNLKDGNEKQQEVPKQNFFPASIQLRNSRGQFEKVDHTLLSKQFEQYLVKTGNLQANKA